MVPAGAAQQSTRAQAHLHRTRNRRGQSTHVHRFRKIGSCGGVNNALPRGSDPVVAAVNSRQIFDVFSRYLSATLAEEPATPADLATAVRKQASTLEEVVILDQEGFSNSDPELKPVVDANSASADTIRQLCK
jgi:hypothetical protein